MEAPLPNAVHAALLLPALLQLDKAVPDREKDDFGSLVQPGNFHQPGAMHSDGIDTDMSRLAISLLDLPCASRIAPRPTLRDKVEPFGVQSGLRGATGYIG